MNTRRAMRGSVLLNGLVALSTVLSLASCAGGSQWWRTVQWEDYTLQTLPQSQSYPGVGAIILLDEGTMEPFGSGVLGYSVFEQHRIVRVFDARGERYANVVIPYGTSSEIDAIQARTITPSGTILPLRQQDVHDVSLYPDFVFFSDQRAKIFTLPGVEPGAVLEYRYRLKVGNRTVWHGWRFQSDVPTLISRFTMLVPSEWPVSFRTYGIEIEPDIRRVPNGFKSTFRWEARDLPAMMNETGMPPPSERCARLTIAPLGFKTWNDVAAWYRKLSGPREDDNAGIESLVDSLIAGVSEPDQRMRILYEWVRDRVRYLAVEIGIGGFQPHRAGEICANRYGDCKDMATLLSAMGDAAGISIEQVLISTWQNGTPDTTLPSPYHFNHAITYVPDLRGGLWMDATAKSVPYGELPWYDQGVPVLVVGDDGEATITVTPKVEAPANSERVFWSASLDSSGSARVRARIMLSGAPAMEARDVLTHATEQERRRWMEERLPRECASNAVIDTVSLTGLAPVEDSLELEVVFAAPLFAGQEEGALRFRPGMIMASGLADLFHPGTRQHPIRFRFGMQRELVLDVTLPRGWYVSFSPQADSVISPFGSWSSVLTTTPRGIHFRRLVRLEGQEIRPEEYGSYRRFLDALRTNELQGVILRRTESEIPVRASDGGNLPSGLRGDPAAAAAESESGI